MSRVPDRARTGIYEPKGGGTFTLTQALDELRGVRGARILRADDLSVAVLDAGDVTRVIHLRRDGRQTTVTCGGGGGRWW